MKDRAGLSPRPGRKDLGHQRRRHRPFAARSDRDQETQDRDLPERLCTRYVRPENTE